MSAVVGGGAGATAPAGGGSSAGAAAAPALPLAPPDAALLAEARAVRPRAYAPYSGFQVGAAVQTERGVFAGVNVENAAYPLTVCAERNAIAAAVAAGARRIEAIAVVADTAGPVAPCGGCRQVIHELGPEARVILGSLRGPVEVTSIARLLPGAFGPADVLGADAPARRATLAAAAAAGPAPDSDPAAGAGSGAGALAGVRVVDLTRILAGPFASMRLADLGATVWKVENPDGGDDTRAWGPPFHGDVATYYMAVNRGKRSIALDLKHADGKRALWRLIERADVLIENFRAGALERLGFGWEELARRAPGLVYCSISGYGHRSRYRDRPSYDVVIQGESGVMDLTGFPDGPPVKCGLSIADMVAGMNAVEGILAALCARRRTGRGARVDVALFDGMLAMLTFQGQMLLSSGRPPRRMGNAHPSIVPYECFRTADGHLNIGVGNDHLWARCCDVLGAPEWKDEPRYATNQGRVEHRAELKERIEERLAARTTAHWHEALLAAGVPCGRVCTVAEAFAAARADERGLLVALAHPSAGRVEMVGSPVRVEPAAPASPPPSTSALPPPGLGEHTDEVLAAAGLVREEIAALRAAGAAA